jgi:hypothetical protein
LGLPQRSRHGGNRSGPRGASHPGQDIMRRWFFHRVTGPKILWPQVPQDLVLGKGVRDQCFAEPRQWLRNPWFSRRCCPALGRLPPWAWAIEKFPPFLPTRLGEDPKKGYRGFSMATKESARASHFEPRWPFVLATHAVIGLPAVLPSRTPHAFPELGYLRRRGRGPRPDCRRRADGRKSTVASRRTHGHPALLRGCDGRNPLQPAESDRGDVSPTGRRTWTIYSSAIRPQRCSAPPRPFR